MEKNNINPVRCKWVSDDPIYITYHDQEWGVPEYDDYKLFSHLILDMQQAGLSWITILKKRDNFLKAYDDLNPNKIARYDEKKFTELMNNPGIIRNRLKIESTINNAKCFLDLQEKKGSFSKYLWSFVDGKPIINQWKSLQEVPAQTPKSIAMSKDLKKMGFRFLGPTICYAFMQAVGMVNDHTTDCFRHQQLIPIKRNK